LDSLRSFSKLCFYHNQQVNVAFWFGHAIRIGAKQDSPLGVKTGYDLVNYTLDSRQRDTRAFGDGWEFPL
jgi:hypothetical protein